MGEMTSLPSDGAADPAEPQPLEASRRGGWSVWEGLSWGNRSPHVQPAVLSQQLCCLPRARTSALQRGCQSLFVSWTVTTAAFPCEDGARGARGDLGYVRSDTEL